MNIKSIKLIALLSIACSSIGQTSKESSLWGPNGVNWDPAGRLPDFSYAGYHSSEKGIPNVPQVANLTSTGAKADDNIDDSQKLQQLIDAQVGVNINSPGAIFIPKGRWIIDNPVEISRSGLVLRGEVDANGKPLTEFYFPNATSNKTSYHVSMTGRFNTTTLGTIASNTNQGLKTFNVNYSGGTKFNVGDFIKLTQEDDANDSFSDYLHGNIDHIGASTKDLSFHPKMFYWYAKVVSVSGNSITVDRPLPVKVQTSWKPTLSRFNMNSSKSEMGIENIVFKCNHDVAFKHNDYMGFRILDLSEVINCWVKNVELVDLEYGIRIQKRSCYNTVTGVVIRDEKRNIPLPNVAGKSDADAIYTLEQKAGGGHHPLEVFTGYYNLIENFEFKDIYWHELSVEGAAAFNVFRNGKGIAVAFDNHRNAPYANLWTNIDIGRPERLWWNSGSNQPGVTGRERGSNCGFRNTYWNITYKNVSPGARIPAAKTDGFSYLNYIGVVDGRKQGSPAATVNSQLVEISGANEKVAQPDIFIAQLNKRNGTVSANKLPKVTITAPSNNAVYTLGETINISASATDDDGTIAKVNFKVNDAFYSNDITPLYTAVFTPTTAGLYKIAARAYDDKDASTEEFIMVNVKEIEVKEPYTGTAISLPGTIQAENYDKGGQGVSFNDTDIENRGALYRNDGVDIDAGNNSNVVGWTAEGEWLEYTVNVTTAGAYDFQFHTSSANGGGLLSLVKGATTLVASTDVPATGDWNTYTSFTKSATLAVGQQVIRLNILKAGFNIDKIVVSSTPLVNTLPTVSILSPANNEVFFLGESVVISADARDTDGTITKVNFKVNDAYYSQDFTPTFDAIYTPTAVGEYKIAARAFDNSGGATEVFVTIQVIEEELKGPYTGTPFSIPGTIEAELYDKGGEGISYHDTNPVNSGSANFRTEDGVDISVGGSGMVLSYVSTNEWLEYTVNVLTAGSYDFEFHASSLSGGGMIGMDLDQVLLFTGVSIPLTGAWNNYQVVTRTATLSEGKHVLRLSIEKNGFNFDKIVVKTSPVTNTEINLETAQIQIFPNPSTTGRFTLSQATQWTVLTSTGQRIGSGDSNTIDVSNQAKGMYIIQTKDQLVKVILE